jgi:hypothetical protein
LSLGFRLRFVFFVYAFVYCFELFMLINV